jgi:hypothetical protein
MNTFTKNHKHLLKVITKKIGFKITNSETATELLMNHKDSNTLNIKSIIIDNGICNAKIIFN